MSFAAPWQLALVATAALACATPTRDRAWLDASARARTGHRIGGGAHEAPPLPPDCSLDDGLDADEAASIASWRSPALQAELSRLDAALADLDEAARPPNPRLSLLAPIDPRQLAAILAWPIDALWQLPLRREAAMRGLEVVAESLVQRVLDLERDVGRAHADAVAARGRAAVLAELAAHWEKTAALTLGRAGAGDTSLAEASAARAEAAIAADDGARARGDVDVMDARLLAALAVPWPALPELVVASRPSAPDESALIERAMDSRPDLRAAALAVHAAAARARWERSRAFALVATLDGQAAPGELEPRFSGGAQLDVPIFSLNPGGVGRAEAEVTRAGYAYLSLRLAVTAEVVAASVARDQARASLAAYDAALQALGEASLGARSAHAQGEESYLFVVDALRREAQAKLRRVDLEADLTRADAELARAVGGLRRMGGEP